MKFRKGSMPFLLVALVLTTGPRMNGNDSNGEHRFHLHSRTFANHTTLPLSTIATFPVSSTNSSNACTFNGEAGGNQSPELSWAGAPERTRSFVVVMYDVTASFTHWGMYNISGKASGLPANAGVANSSFGNQIANDYGIGDLSYDGPCPPTGASPQTHDYVFTVYALDTRLPMLAAFGDFQPGSEALYHALVAAARDGHIMASASLVSSYSAAAPPGSGK